MGTDWKTGFHRALVNAIVRNGSPHDPSRDSYWGSSLPDGWVEIGPRVAAVGIDYIKTPKPVEANWYEFAGTFADGDNRKYGVDLELVLLDGTRVWYRYDGSLAALILAVVTDDDLCSGSGQHWIIGRRNRECPVCHTTARAINRLTGKVMLRHRVTDHPVKEQAND